MTPGAQDGSIVRFDRVTVRFEDLKALDEVSFDIRAGQTRIILGAAGSGKTVLLKTALGLVKPESGKVFLFGQEINRLSEDQLFPIRRKAGMLFQESALFDSLTIEENVAYPLVTRRSDNGMGSEQVLDRVKEVLRFVELEQTLDRFPSELSGGMRRRVGIARAAVAAPALMLYDSPTAGLDPITANTIIALIVKERDLDRTTAALVTHRYQDGHMLANFRYNPDSGELEPVAARGDHPDLHTTFMVMREGKLVFEGTQKELEESSDPYLQKFVRR